MMDETMGKLLLNYGNMVEFKNNHGLPPLLIIVAKINEYPLLDDSLKTLFRLLKRESVNISPQSDSNIDHESDSS
jgi:hypothetical protein